MLPFSFEGSLDNSGKKDTEFSLKIPELVARLEFSKLVILKQWYTSKKTQGTL